MASLVMVNGIPGKMATLVANRIVTMANRYDLFDRSLSGHRGEAEIEGRKVKLVSPIDRAGLVLPKGIIVIDYTTPSSVNDNIRYYAENGIPFVIGTTGVDKDRLTDVVRANNATALVSPNMAKPIVAFLAMLKQASDAFPLLFRGYTLEIVESHQSAKKDVSGTARAAVAYFRQLGLDFEESQIRIIRDVTEQREIGVPPEHLTGHGWHTYRIVSADKTVKFEITHNVCGRSIYVDGTIDALEFMEAKIAFGQIGLYTMMDVITQTK